MRALTNSERLRVGVVLERRAIAHPWQEYAWHASAVVPGAPDIPGPRLVAQGEGWARHHMATLDIELFPRETEGYRYNLSQAQPAVYVLWRHEGEDSAAPPELFHVTVCPYEAQDYLDGGDVVVEAVPVPDVVMLWMRSYIDRHHIDEPFAKRRRKRHEAAEEEEEFG